VELYWDRAEDEWPREADGRVAMFTARLDVEDLLTEPEPESRPRP
jgi:catechol 2,3-dioxygenase